MKHRSTSLWLIATLALGGCGRAGLELPDDGLGGGGAGGNASSSSRSGSGTGASGSTSSTAPTSGSMVVSGSTSTGVVTCVVAQECEDGDPCTSNRCQGGTCVFDLRDDDMDGVVADTCGGGDCNDLNPNVFPGQPEDCFDGSDNDCNGVSDCFDPACAFVPDCGCTPDPAGERCDNGVDDDCDMTVDCNDADCAGTPACGCAPSESGLCGNGFDDDCDDATDCDDADCAGTMQCQCMNAFEFCGDAQDNDCDLLIDCADPDCDGVFPCACVPPGTPEICNNGVDDDCDDRPDCADPDCAVSPSCQNCMPEICDNGADDDCDQRIDCADDACAFAPNCTPQPEQCNNGLDDDQDGRIDCQDTDCAQNPTCLEEQANCLSPKLISSSGSFFGDTTGHVSETKGACGGDAGEAVFFFVLDDPSFVELDSIGTSFDSTIYVRTGACNSGREIGCDDDSAGSLASRVTLDILYPGTYFVFLDGYTVDPNGGPNEGPFQLNVTIIENPVEQCNDGIDNDGDVFVDCADSDCTFDAACINCNAGNPPEPELAPGRCTDGLDNDCDGTVDCGDEDCSASDFYTLECCNGIDETMNGVVDDFNCRCATTADCDGGQICYDHTVRACGIPCDNFFGDVCPFIAPGSACNAFTRQCEFP